MNKTLNRLPDWEARLDAVARAWMLRPYHLISANCCHLAGDVIEAVTGDNWWQRWSVEPPQSMEDVARLRLRFGGTAGIARTYFGCAQQAVLSLRPGDLLLTSGDHDDTLAVVIGNGALCITDTGLRRIELDDGFGGWAVGA